MTISAVLFDKDGVLVDFQATWTPVLRDFAPQFTGGNMARADELLAIAGYDHGTDRFAAGSIWAAGNTNDLVAAWLPDAGTAARQELAVALDAACAEAVPVALLESGEMAALFGGLKQRGLHIGMATNDSEHSARRTLATFGIAGMFDKVMGYDSVARPKPAPDQVVAFCGHCGIAAGEVAMVGDNLHDMEMAETAGTGLAIAVLSGNARRAELAPLADHIIDTAAGVPGVLDRAR